MDLYHGYICESVNWQKFDCQSEGPFSLGGSRYQEESSQQNEYLGPFLIVGAVISYCFYQYLQGILGLKPTMPSKKKKYFQEILHYVKENVEKTKQVLYREYLQQSIGDLDSH